MKRVAKWTALTLGALLILVLGVAAWSVNTQSGARSVARIAVNVLSGKLALGNVEGTIAGPLTVTDLRYNDPEAGIDARLQRVHVDIVFTDIFRARVHVHEIQASGIDVTLSEPTQPEEPKKPFSLKPPIDLAIDSLALDSARATIPEGSRREPRMRSGPVLAVPGEEGPILVQSLFWNRPDGAPVVSRVGVLDGKRLAVGLTIADAVSSLRGVPNGPRRDPTLPAGVAREERMARLYEVMRDAMRRGDWTRFGAALDSLGAMLGRPPR